MLQSQNASGNYAYGPVLEISFLIAYAQMPIINDHVDVSSEARCLTFGLSLHLHPHFLYASSEGSGESARLGIRWSLMR